MKQYLFGLAIAALALLAPLSAQARFLQPDTWDPWFLGVDTNRYAYCNNDPINCEDPDGHDMFGVGGGNFQNWSTYAEAQNTVREALSNPDLASAAINVGQSYLDVAGFSPIGGTFADLANAGIDAARGNYLSAAVNIAASVPAIGDAIKAGKMARSGVRHFNDLKVFGKEQITQGAAGLQHAARSENLARKIVDEYGIENIKAIHYNRSLSNLPGVKDLRRPDVIVELNNGDLILGEVASGSQTVAKQQGKLEDMISSLFGRNVSGKLDNEMAKDGLSSMSHPGGSGDLGSAFDH